MLNATEKIAVRFNFQKMAPLGIADSDYRRVAMALDLNEGEVRAAGGTGGSGCGGDQRRPA